MFQYVFIDVQSNNIVNMLIQSAYNVEYHRYNRNSIQCSQCCQCFHCLPESCTPGAWLLRRVVTPIDTEP